MPIPAGAVSIPQDATGLLLPWGIRSPEVHQSSPRAEHAKRLGAEGGSRYIPHLKCLRDSSSSPSMMTTSSFRVLQSAPNRAVGCRPSYSVLAMRSVRRHSGWLEPSAGARPGLLSSTARGNVDEVGEHEVGNTCAGGHGEKVFEERPRDVCTCVGIVGGELERTVERELHGGAEALRDAGKLVQAMSSSEMMLAHRTRPLGGRIASS
ncbi:hypothetical protein EDB92DRAFT_1814452 [Lactarius akahatsu]|uniref:Uncharacterized protein n=1 Tax=Lactarius akahatsu TaxID=416441 RepID=A0AAD4QFP7_9AGAM|nr:hypothetical protein EDB92DRAFT_1814452 [Lactarius akahatsu]